MTGIAGPFPPIIIGYGKCPACGSRQNGTTAPGEGPGGITSVGELYDVERFKRPKWMETYDPGDKRVYGSMAQWAKFLEFCEQCWTLKPGGRLQTWLEQEKRARELRTASD